MKTELLRVLMLVCSLGEAWRNDFSKIPVDAIIEVWRCGSTRGRYEQAMWDAMEKYLKDAAAAASHAAVAGPSLLSPLGLL